MISNFAFLEGSFPDLAHFGKLAEKYLYTDSNSCLMKLGMLGEQIIKLMCDYDKIQLPADCTAADRIYALRNAGLLDEPEVSGFHALRIARNKAVHENYRSVEQGKALLRTAHRLCEWFMLIYGDYSYTSRDFVLPSPTDEILSAEENAQKEKELLAKAEAKAKAAAQAEKKDRKEKAAKAKEIFKKRNELSESETRLIIDEALRRAGWEADTENIRASKGVRPEKGHNRAIAEWATGSDVGLRGAADYALFIGEKLVGIIEAKKAHTQIPSVIDYQCTEYAAHIRETDEKYTIGQWDKFKVPFLFATNGREFIKQDKINSGIWFRDVRKKENISRALSGWMSPEGILALLEKNDAEGDAKLEKLPFDPFTDKNGLGLRPYQVDAIRAAEKAVKNGKKEILLAMATGTGKTRTILGLIYRFLKTGRFRRVLYLVDRNILGEQADAAFTSVPMEDFHPIGQIYNIKKLEEKVIDEETKIHIATVQSMVRRIFAPNEEERRPSVSDYDLIIIDEAHRGYILDREMAEGEDEYRDQRDYQSKYAAVIDYFDAVKVAMTATPALHTIELFGAPVYTYSYREAVIDGYLVDHDAPHKLVTQLAADGIHYKKGDAVSVIDENTGEVVEISRLPDEMDFKVDDFNRTVITENFDRTVLQEIARGIDPEERAKTLIFAVSDAHADRIVNILREIYSEEGVPAEAILKITGSVGGGDRKKVLAAVSRFKNEHYPTVAVTVDLLTTGVDVREISTLVFMRRVKSRILFEQMLGRATRLCPEIGKTHFEIYDPVGVYESLSPVITMPSVVSAKDTFEDLLEGLSRAAGEEEMKNSALRIVARLQGKKKHLSDEAKETFEEAAGKTIEDYIADVREEIRRDPGKAKDTLLAAADLLKRFDEKGESASGRPPIVISDKDDALLEHSRIFGKEQKPEDYLAEFETYIRTHRNEIDALEIICTRPKTLTKESLRSLARTLAKEGFTTRNLSNALSQTTNKEILTDLITLIRRAAIGSPLISHEARVRGAMEKLRANHKFDAIQLKWLKTIENCLTNETDSVFTEASFAEDIRLKNKGGFKQGNKAFKGELSAIVSELNDYLYDDGIGA